MPFVSDRPSAYGRLLLAVYVRWKSGVLVPSDWLRPVRGAVGEPASRSVREVWMTSADQAVDYIKVRSLCSGHSDAGC